MKREIMKKVVGSALVASILAGTVLVHTIMDNGASRVKAFENKYKDVVAFEFNSSALDESSVHLVNEAVYKSEYFKGDSTEYNHELAQLSLSMAMASSTTAESKKNWGDNYASVVDTNTDIDDIDIERDRNAYIVDVYKKLGFYNDVYKKYDVSLNDTSDTIAYSIAMKDIKIDNEKYTLLLCNARSVSYGAEWASNFSMYNEDGISGFRAAGEDFYKAIKAYIKKHKLGENTKVWLPGYSRGGAAANVATALLDQDIESGKYEFTRNDVFSYIFATPQSSIDEDYDNEIYNNIFNIVNEADIVPTTAPAYWGFRRYGRVIKVPQIKVNSRQLDRIEQGKRVNLDEESIELIKNVSYEYNKIRFTNMYEPDNTKNPKELYVGFTVDPEFLVVIDGVIRAVADNAQEYGEKYQGVTKEIVPFLISHTRTYSEEEGQWVAYETLADYLCAIYGEEVFAEASNAGIFSQTEYREKLENIENMKSKNLINEKTASMFEYLVNTYYGIRIIAFNYGIDVEIIKEFTGNILSQAWEILDEFNINDPLYCKYVHYAEFYLAWMRNYNPYTRTVVKNDANDIVDFDKETMAVKVDVIAQEMEAEIADVLEVDSDVAMSSNPYSYVESCESYDKLVDLGEEALLPMYEYINKHNSGVDTYIMALAMEEIAGCDVYKETGIDWSTSKEFLRAWNKYKGINTRVTKSNPVGEEKYDYSFFHKRIICRDCEKPSFDENFKDIYGNKRQRGIKYCDYHIGNMATDVEFVEQGYTDYNCLAYSLGEIAPCNWIWPASWSAKATVTEVEDYFEEKGYNVENYDENKQEEYKEKKVIYVYGVKDEEIGYEIVHFGRTDTAEGQDIGEYSTISKWGMGSVYKTKNVNSFVDTSGYGECVFVCYK